MIQPSVDGPDWKWWKSTEWFIHNIFVWFNKTDSDTSTSISSFNFHIETQMQTFHLSVEGGCEFQNIRLFSTESCKFFSLNMWFGQENIFHSEGRVFLLRAIINNSVKSIRKISHLEKMKILHLVRWNLWLDPNGQLLRLIPTTPFKIWCKIKSKFGLTRT